MGIKQTIKAVGNYIIDAEYTGVSVARALWRPVGDAIPHIGKGKRLFVFANGLSFGEVMDHHAAFLQDHAHHDVFMMNHTAKQDVFEKVRPNGYILADPAFWGDECDEVKKKDATKTVNAIIEKTTWDMYLFVAADAKRNRPVDKSFARNRNLHVVYVNLVPYRGIAFFQNLLYAQHRCLPVGLENVAINVLAMALYAACEAQYKEVYIWGCEQDMFRDMVVDEDNQLWYYNKHYYKESKGMEKRPMPPENLWVWLRNFANAFREYCALEQYSNTKGCKIYNATPTSFINAFQKVRVDELAKDWDKENGLSKIEMQRERI